MKTYRLPVVTFSFLFIGYYAFSQPKTRTLTGVVKSFEESFPLEGVAVVIKGTNKSSGTQADGVYYISVSEKDSVLLFSLPGYQTQEVKIAESNEYNIILKAANYSSSALRQENYLYGRAKFLHERCSNRNI